MNKKRTNNKVLYYIIIALIIVFVFLVGMTFKKYYEYKKDKSTQVIQITEGDKKIVINNSGNIDKTINTKSFIDGDKIILTNIDSIEYSSEDISESNIINYDIKYLIKKNDFINNMYKTNSSEVLVRFSYSYDLNNWTYINNVISTDDSTLTPLMGDYYDIAGLIGTLRVKTNYDLKLNDSNSKTIYWRSETIFQNSKRHYDNNGFSADFKIVYNAY